MEVFATLSPAVTAIINNYLANGVVPASFKHAVVHPLLNKPHLDPSILSNFRPISKFPFTSKLLKRVVYSQLDSYISMSIFLDTFQSGFRYLHSTETALLKVSNYPLQVLDTGSHAVLFYLSAAFDTIDHCILLHRLENWWELRVLLCSGWLLISKTEPSQ